LECEDDVLRRLVERQVLSRDYRASEPVGKGPIIVAVDQSGSMEGEPVHTAKALALAMAWIARQQHRWAALVAYSGDSGERLLAFPPGRWYETALLDWLAAFIDSTRGRFQRKLATPSALT
jgi:Mg-chelatase subunit ChlD